MSKLKSLYVALLALYGAASCTDVNYNVGDSMIPDSDILDFRVDTLSGFDSYTKSVDSIVTSAWGTALCGTRLSPTYGKSTYSFVSTVLPGSGLSVDSIWGIDPIVDSVDFVLAFSDTLGYNDMPQEFLIYELQKPLGIEEDSIKLFYSNFDYKSYIDETAGPLTTIKVSGSESSIYTSRLEKSFGEQYTDTTGNIYDDVKTYFERFRGFYVESPTSFSTNVYKAIDLEGSGLYIYYHNSNEEPDTTIAFFSMMNGDGMENVAFTLINHDFSSVDPVEGIDTTLINDSTSLFDKSYVVSQGALMTELDLNETNFKNYKQEILSDEYKRVAVSNATLIVPLYNPTMGTMDMAPEKMGAYIDYPSYMPVQDLYEEDMLESYGIVHPFGGLLNRAAKAYQLDITAHIQQLFDEEVECYTIDLATALQYAYLPTGVSLDKDNIKLALTYYLIKK